MLFRSVALSVVNRHDTRPSCLQPVNVRSFNKRVPTVLFDFLVVKPCVRERLCEYSEDWEVRFASDVMAGLQEHRLQIMTTKVVRTSAFCNV